ncbi:MAG TPA: hypothetical protein VHA52_08300 [Candidatus Babeliaceae bacterium]|nr:hypothetical protein [Candidatus Babeliaceae bacterium]
MVNLIRQFGSKLASTAYAYTPSLDTVANLAKKSFDTVAAISATVCKATGIAYTAVTATVLPNEACEKWITDALKSFSFKKAIDSPTAPEVVDGITLLLSHFFDVMNIPGKDKLLSFIRKEMQKPKTQIEAKTYETLIRTYIQPNLTPDNVNKLTTSVLDTVQQLIHAIVETEKNPGQDPRTELLRQLGIETSFDEYKARSQKELTQHIDIVLEQLSKLFTEGKNPIAQLFIKLGFSIAAGILCLLSPKISETLNRFVHEKYLDIISSNHGLHFKNDTLSLEFNITSQELSQLYTKFKDYHEIILTFFIYKTIKDLANFDKLPSDVDQKYKTLLDELQPIVSTTISAATSHTSSNSLSAVALKYLTSFALKMGAVPLAFSYLHQLEPSSLIKTAIKGLQESFERDLATLS